MKESIINEMCTALHNAIEDMVKEIDTYSFKGMDDETKVKQAIMETAGYMRNEDKLYLLHFENGKFIFKEVNTVAYIDDIKEHYTKLLTAYFVKTGSEESVSEPDFDLLEFVKAQMPSSIQETASIEDIINYAKEYK